MKTFLSYSVAAVLWAAVVLVSNPNGVKAEDCLNADGSEYAYVIYASTGECDIEKVAEVGKLNVNYSNGSVSVDFPATDDFGVDETEFYVGSESLASYGDGEFTIVPGKYRLIGASPAGSTGDSIVAIGAQGEIYIIAPALTC